jgi:hypothetical protein
MRIQDIFDPYQQLIPAILWVHFHFYGKERRKYLTNPSVIISHPLSYPTPLNVGVKLLQKNLFCVNDSIYGNKQLQLVECKGGSGRRKVGEVGKRWGGGVC